jgi:hypothetical protein
MIGPSLCAAIVATRQHERQNAPGWRHRKAVRARTPHGPLAGH